MKGSVRLQIVELRKLLPPEPMTTMLSQEASFQYLTDAFSFDMEGRVGERFG